MNQHTLTSEEEKRLLEACSDLRLLPIVVAAIDTGMRRSELLSLKWRDVDLEHGQITVLETKSKQARRVLIPTRLSRELKTLYAQNSEDQGQRVFGVADNAMMRLWRNGREAARLPDLRFRDLRRARPGN